MKNSRPVLTALFLFFLLLFSSCGRVTGYGILLWARTEPEIPAGTVLPVYVRSNIEQVYVAGIPKEFRLPGSEIDKIEIPLAQLRFAGSRGAARKQAEQFAEYALIYAENLQDGLPVREFPDNGSRRIYRLKAGQIVKILEKSEGNPAVGASGDPLPGAWYRVLTEDGSAGYCFSYRLRFFEHTSGPLTAAVREEAVQEDTELERVLAVSWYPESYGNMIATGQIDIEELSRNYRFFPGQDTGLARIYLPSMDRTFSYTAIRRDRPRSWYFEGSTLQMTLRAENLLALQAAGEAGAARTFLFVPLPADPGDSIIQETERRETLYRSIYQAGPVFSSSNYGTIVFTQAGRFTWQGNGLLVPGIIPAATLDSGAVEMRLYLDGSLQSRYTGAFTLRFDGAGRQGAEVNFMYTLEAQGLRIEHVSESSMNGIAVSRRDPSPTVIYFFRERN
jgi:hypothetical protein